MMMNLQAVHHHSVMKINRCLVVNTTREIAKYVLPVVASYLLVDSVMIMSVTIQWTGKIFFSFVLCTKRKLFILCNIIY